MELLSSIGNHFYGIFQAGGNFLSIYIVNFIPWILLMITFMLILSRVIGLLRIEKLMTSLSKNPITRWTLMPVVGMLFSGKTQIANDVRFLPERQKAAFLDSSASFYHPATGLFPHTNPGELFVFLGIATGVYLAGYELGFLAISYFLIGVIVILIRGFVTELIYHLKDKRKEAPHKIGRAHV